MTRPYEKIKVSSICDEANISRPLFYTYYKDKDDLLEKIIFKDLVQTALRLQESLPRLKVKSAAQLIIERTFSSILENRDFYSRVNAISNGALLVRALAKRGTELGARILDETDLSDLEKSYLAPLTATAHAILVSKWIERGYDADPKQMTRFSRKWIMDCWKPYFDLEYN